MMIDDAICACCMHAVNVSTRVRSIDNVIMATSYGTSEVCKVVEDKGISNIEMEESLTEFLGKKHVCKGLSADDYCRLKRLHEALAVENSKIKEMNPVK